MPDSQNPEHVRKLVAEFQLKGANLIPTVTAEIVPTVVVADLSVERRAEDRLGVGAIHGAASGAGNQNFFDIVNPTLSGVMLYVDAFWAVGAAIDNVGIELLPQVAAGTPTEWRDGRVLGNPACQMHRFAPAATPLPDVTINVGVASFPFPIGYIVPPGNLLRVQQDAQNTALDLFIFFRERDVRPGE